MRISYFEMVENLGKGENAGLQHCLIFLIYFQRPSSLGSPKVGCGKGLTFYHTIRTINNLKKNAFENIMEKGENTGTGIFFLSYSVF